MTAADEAIRATAHGRVQGVGYRASVVDRARDLGLLGWVRNQDDGTVLLHAEGTDEALRALEAFLREGPPAAEVSEVTVVATKVEGHEQFAVRGVAAGRFVVEEHAGESPAYVLRLEVDGAFRSWRLTREPSMVPAEKRFASQLAGDAAEPGAGAAEGGGGERGGDGEAADDAEPTPTVWDAGPYEQGGRVAWPEAVERGHAVFVLHGERLRGGFALQRTRGSGPRAGWLLIKRRDEFAQAS